MMSPPLSIHHPLVTPYIRALFRWRWFVLLIAIGIALAVVVEVAEGHRLDDFRLYLEILIFGLLVPLSFSILLIVTTYYALRYRQSKYKFELHRRLSQQLIQRPEWSELTRFVTQFPGVFLPVTRASLYTYDYRGTRFEFAAEWNADGLMSFGRPFNGCEACPPGAACKRLNRVKYDAGSQGAPNPDSSDYCLPLSYDNLLIGVLKLKPRPGWEFSLDQINFMQAIAPEIALALALAIARPREMMQVRAKAQIEERYRAACELHNTTAQQVGYLHFNLDRLANDKRLDGEATIRAELENLRRVADDAYQDVRRTLVRLRSPEALDLSGAIVAHAEKVSQSTELQIDVTHQGEPKPLSAHLCRSVFDLVQEGLNNIQKHAQARHVQVALKWSADDLRLQLVDDGIGFDPAAPARYGHYGIAMMREQAKALSGMLVVESSHYQGTKLSFCIPLQR